MIRLPLKIVKEENEDAPKGYHVYLFDADEKSLWAFEDEETLRFIAKACNNYGMLVNTLLHLANDMENKSKLLTLVAMGALKEQEE